MGEININHRLKESKNFVVGEVTSCECFSTKQRFVGRNFSRGIQRNTLGLMLQIRLIWRVLLVKCRNGGRKECSLFENIDRIARDPIFFVRRKGQ